MRKLDGAASNGEAGGRVRRGRYSRTENALVMAAGFAAVFFGVMGCVYLAKTIVNQWVVIGIAVGVAAASVPLGLKFWRWTVPGFSKWVDAGLHLVFVSSLVFFLILCINSAGADFEKGERVEAVVVRKFTKEHTSSGTGRLHRGAGRKYDTWHILLEFPNGKEKEVQVGREAYNRIRTGEGIELTVATGALGMEVIGE